MHTRKKSITRDLLRVLEIALFFAVSVLGYGLLAKTSTSGARSKPRNHPADIRNTLLTNGVDRALRIFPAMVISPARTALSEKLHPATGCVPPIDVAHRRDHRMLHDLPADHDIDSVSAGTSPSPHLPFNLLQQNPVLLV